MARKNAGEQYAAEKMGDYWKFDKRGNWVPRTSAPRPPEPPEVPPIKIDPLSVKPRQVRGKGGSSTG